MTTPSTTGLTKNEPTLRRFGSSSCKTMDFDRLKPHILSPYSPVDEALYQVADLI